MGGAKRIPTTLGTTWQRARASLHGARAAAGGAPAMCGIAGYLCTGRDPLQAEAVVRAMVAALHHRGPDANGVHRDGPAVLGHARLAIIDLRPESNQPFLSADGEVALVFNGEIYNYKALAEDLKASGVVLRTRSDTEVILELYRRDGLDFLQELRGMFAVGPVDRD